MDTALHLSSAPLPHDRYVLPHISISSNLLCLLVKCDALIYVSNELAV